MAVHLSPSLIIMLQCGGILSLEGSAGYHKEDLHSKWVGHVYPIEKYYLSPDKVYIVCVVCLFVWKLKGSS